MSSQSLLITWDRQTELLSVPDSESKNCLEIQLFSSELHPDLLAEKKHLQIFLPTEITPSYQKSLLHFFEAKFEILQLTDLFIHLENPILQLFLDLSSQSKWNLWIEGRELLQNWPKIPDNPEQIYWVCRSFQLAETLMIKGISALHLFYPERDKIPTFPIYPIKEQISEYFLPYPSTPYGMDGEEGLFCLIQISHAQPIKGEMIKAFIETFVASETVKLVILPQFLAGVDVASQIYDSLLNWFESEGINSEEVPEIIVLEPHIADYWPVFSSPPIYLVQSYSPHEIQIALQVLREGGWVVSQSLEFIQKMTQIQEPLKSFPPDFPQLLAPWLNQFADIVYFNSDPTSFYLWNQAQLKQAAYNRS